ncbi:MAG: type II toxin-antitoxin system RelE family toxin [Nitrosotalea sp.]
MWLVHRKNVFNRDYKHLSSDLQKKTMRAVRDLVASQDPRKMGDHKTGPLNCLHTYELGQQFRVLYDVQFEQDLLVLLRVGTHKIY